jgi:Ca2+-dependent lipid-binding protein
MIKRSTHPVYSESFLIPAISGHQVIVLTVIDRGLIKDEVIGQAIVNLAEKSLWNRGGSLALHLRVMEVSHHLPISLFV